MFQAGGLISIGGTSFWNVCFQERIIRAYDYFISSNDLHVLSSKAATRLYDIYIKASSNLS